jgi:hypothetical protein
MAGGSYVYLCCGNRVRHGSEQPYHRLPMLRGLTGLRMQTGSHVYATCTHSIGVYTR